MLSTLILIVCMNRIEFNSQVNENVTVGVSAACNQVGMKISTNKSEVSCFYRNPRQCTLQASGNTVCQVERFKCLRVIFRSDRKQNKEIDTRNNKGKHFCMSLITLWS